MAAYYCMGDFDRLAQAMLDPKSVQPGHVRYQPDGRAVREESIFALKTPVSKGPAQKSFKK